MMDYEIVLRSGTRITLPVADGRSLVEVMASALNTSGMAQMLVFAKPEMLLSVSEIAYVVPSLYMQSALSRDKA